MSDKPKRQTIDRKRARALKAGISTRILPMIVRPLDSEGLGLLMPIRVES